MLIHKHETGSIWLTLSFTQNVTKRPLICALAVQQSPSVSLIFLFGHN